MEFRSSCLLLAFFTILFLMPVIVNAPVLADFGGGFTEPFTNVDYGCVDIFGNYVC